MNCLVCTHHLHAWAGSETVTIELVEALRARGHSVTLFCVFADTGFIRSALGPDIKILVDPAQVFLSQFDLVFTHHQSTARFLALQSDDALFGADRPVFVYNHMSPTDLFERPGPFSQAHFADLILCNSHETRDVLRQRDSQFDEAELWPNPAPPSFEREHPPEPSPVLKRLLCVSNHLPEAMSRALDLLSAQGVQVTKLGRPGNSARLTPDHLFSHDAVVTIGKTVQCALRARVPVYCYDRHFGPGWLSDGNFEAAAVQNFSGRSHPHPRSPESLAQDIFQGFSDAAQFAQGISQKLLAPYRLEDHVTRLETFVQSRKARAKKVAKQERERIRTALLREQDMFALVDQQYATARRKDRKVIGVAQVEKPKTSSPITISHLHRKDENRPFIAAVFSFRYDAHLVPAMLENIAPSVDAWIAWDDREAEGAFSGDAKRQTALFDAAQSIGADWILALDPDERFEDRLADKIAEFTAQEPACWTFQCREMFTPDAYRTDGLWGNKPRLRLFPCLPGMEPDDEDLHGNWTRNSLKLPLRDTGLNFYHLRMATPERRMHRRDTYAVADPERDRQGVGYDYLSDDRGCVLEQTPQERRYSPIHIEDGGLWAAPSLPTEWHVQPDPVPSRLRWMTHSSPRGGATGSFHAAKDLFDQDPADSDLGYLSASLALDGGRMSEAKDILERIAQTPAMSQCHTRLLNRLAQASGDASNDDARSDSALWRRWVSEARIHEGKSVAQSDMAAIVLGLRAPAQLDAAVASLRAQDEPLEIVVVNSGGGQPERVLRNHLDHIRLVDVKERLFPGGARNVGIDASYAPFVSFLASDCIASPGWAKGRLERHRSGAQAVASAVVPANPDNLASVVSCAQLHWPRWPQTNSESAALYGVSYARTLFADCGYFPTGPLVGEDTQVNRMIQDKTGIAWAPDVQVAHRYPTSLRALWKDMARRGYNRSFLPPFSTREDETTFHSFVDSWIRGKTEKAHLAILEHLRPSPTRLTRLLLALRLAARAERKGVSKGAQEVFRGRKLVQEAERLPQDRAAEAERMLRQAVSFMPADPACLTALARHLMETDPSHHARELIEIAHQLVATDPHKNADILPLCHAIQRVGHAQDAHHILERATLAAPERAGFWWHRSRVAHWTKQFQDEYDCLQVLLGRTPSDAKLHDALAKLHADQGAGDLSERRANLARVL